MRKRQTPPAAQAPAPAAQAPAPAAQAPAPTGEDAIQAANDAYQKAAEAAAAASEAAASAASSVSESALAPGGDPMGCLAVKDAPESIDDDYCRKQCSDSPDNCPKTFCECDDDNGVLRYDPNDPDIPVSMPCSPTPHIRAPARPVACPRVSSSRAERRSWRRRIHPSAAGNSIGTQRARVVCGCFPCWYL